MQSDFAGVKEPVTWRSWEMTLSKDPKAIISPVHSGFKEDTGM